MSPLNVLIVEDEDITAGIYNHFLRNQGHKVVGIIKRAEEVMTTLEHQKVDLIMMDIQLEGEMTGFEASLELRRKYNVPILFTTGDSKFPVDKYASKVSNSSALIKPVKFEELITEITNLIESLNTN